MSNEPIVADELDDETPRGVVWLVKVGDAVYGPYPRTKLLDYLEEGRIAGHSMIACGPDDEFMRADQHPNLRWDFSARAARGFNKPKLEDGETEVPVSNFFICCRLLAGSQDFEDVLHETGRFARAGGDMWVLRADVTLPQLRNRLSKVMRKDEQMIIVNATKNRIAWFNLGPENDIAVRSVWDIDE